MPYRCHQLIHPIVSTCNYISTGRLHRLGSSKYLKLKHNNLSTIRYYSTDATHTIVATSSTNSNTKSIIGGDNLVDDTTSIDINNSITKIQSTNPWMNDIVIGEKLCPFAIPLWNKNKDSSTTSSTSSSPIRIVSSNATTVQDAITDVQKEIIALVGDKHIDSNNNSDESNSDVNNCNKHETTLIVFDYDNDTLLQLQQQSHTDKKQKQQLVHQQNNNFRKNYMDFVRLSWLLQEKAVGEQYQDLIHIVLFHPLATHQTYGYDTGTNTNPGDYTIRSPYPTIHLLRQQDLLNVVQSNTNYSDYEHIPSRNKAKFIQQGLQVCQERLQRCTRTK